MIKVCTFNILVRMRHATRAGRSGARRWRQCCKMRDRMSRGLQEATLPMLRDLEERLMDYRWMGVGREDGAEER